MEHPPVLRSKRLILRPFCITDAERVRELAGSPEIYATTTNIPYPYEEGMAEKWISTHASDFYNDKGVVSAITLKSDGIVIGAIGLTANREHRRAELGYWIGRPYWGKGYCTEAAKVIIRYGFDALKYHKIYATYMEINPASGKVMEKAGMKKEGTLIDHIHKDGKFHNLVTYGIVDTEPASESRNERFGYV